jgi:hypothetical protein
MIERQGVGNDTLYIQPQMSEGTDAQRPYLDITYTTGGGTPVRHRVNNQ